MTTTDPSHRGRVLRDESLDLALTRDGYLIVPFIDGAEVTRIRASALALRQPDDAGLVIDFVREDRQAMRDVAAILEPVWKRHLPDLFVRYRPIVSTFVVKHSGVGSEMRLHHEPTFVEGASRGTYNIWIPLEDVGPELENGTLELVRGSQDLPFGLVGFNTPVTFRPYETFLREAAVPLTVPAGSAVIYDTRMLHSSGPNRRPAPRVAIAAALGPVEDDLIHVVATGRRHRCVSEVDETFFLDVHPKDATALVESRTSRAVNEDATLPASAIAQAIGATRVPTPRPVLPLDLVLPDDELPLMALAGRRCRRWPRPSSDVDEVPELFAAAAVPESEIALLDVAGDISVVDLSTAPSEALRAAIPAELLDAAGQRGARTLIILRAGGRLRFEVKSRSLDLISYECPLVNSGIRVGDRALNFDCGTTVRLTNRAGGLLWNDGPGSLWLVASRRPSLWGVLRSLAGMDQEAWGLARTPTNVDAPTWVGRRASFVAQETASSTASRGRWRTTSGRSRMSGEWSS